MFGSEDDEEDEHTKRVKECSKEIRKRKIDIENKETK